MKRFAFRPISSFVRVVALFFQFDEFLVPVYDYGPHKAGVPQYLKPMRVGYAWSGLVGEAIGALAVILGVLYPILSAINLIFGGPNPLLDWPWQMVVRLGHEVGLW